MSEAGWILLQQVLVERYRDLRERLTRRLGSAELAGDALHEVYIRLNRGDDLTPVNKPAAYLFKAAYNIALNNRKSEQRLTYDAGGEIAEVPDEVPGPERVVLAKSELSLLARALLALPPRQRAILIAARYKEIPRDEIARRFKISRRQVQFELQQALQACKYYMDQHG